MKKGRATSCLLECCSNLSRTPKGKGGQRALPTCTLVMGRPGSPLPSTLNRMGRVIVHGKHLLSTGTNVSQPLGSTQNVSRFHDNKALQRVRLKGELKPMLSLAIQSFLTKKQAIANLKDSQSIDFTASVELLARWNGYRPIDPSHLIVTENNSGRIDLASGLIAEASPFVAENYRVFAKPRQSHQHQQDQQAKQQHPRFVMEDYSWYRSLEARINDNLDRWEENARKRSKQRRATAKQSLQRLFDLIQAPASNAFGAVTARLGPVADSLRSTVRSHLFKPAPMSDTEQEPSSARNEPTQSEDTSLQKDDIISDSNSNLTSQQMEWNKTEPEDLIIMTRNGETFLLVEDVNPIHRLLTLPVVDVLAVGRSKSKVKAPYRLRMARGGLVITVSLIALGAIAPTYRSLRFILEYPRTAEIVMITLVGSVAYNLWSWRTNAKTRQRELIAAAIQSRLVARNHAAVSHLIVGATECLTHAVMED